MKIWTVLTEDKNGTRLEVFSFEKPALDWANEWLEDSWEDEFYGSKPDDVMEAMELFLDSDDRDHDYILFEEKNVDVDLASLFPDTTRADLNAFGDCNRDSSDNPSVWLNRYSCDHAGQPEEQFQDEDHWDDRHSCQCDDTCPTCGRSVSPHTSIYCAEGGPALEALWLALPENVT